MDLKVFNKRLFERVAAGEAAESVYSSGSSFEVSVREGEILEYGVSDTMKLQMRLLSENGRLGSASTQILDDEAVDMLVDGARENAALIESEDQQFFHDGTGEYKALTLFAPELEAVSAAEKIAMAKELEKLTLSMDDRIEKVDGCAVFYSSAEAVMTNTLGLDISEKVNLLGGYVSVIAKEGEKVNTGFKSFFVKDLKDIDLEKVARGAADDALNGLDAAPVPSGSYRVLLRNDMAATMLSTFSGIFSADNAQRGLSQLKDREGEEVAAECVTIMDDPHLEKGGASSSFDGDGVPTRVKAIVDQGKLTTLLHNLKTARKQGVETTANASAGKGIAPTNFYFKPSELSFDEMVAKTGDGLLITQLMGMHSGANAISGDFSLAARGFSIKDGKLDKAVDQITIAGNFYTLLKDIEAVGGDLQFGFPGGSCFGSPCVLVKSLSVAGK
ncbi:MAG: TldD/PmbA family protein [Clostridia bacterium]|nr:TldD/PmbA family protein [Clostridia bacterium]